MPVWGGDIDAAELHELCLAFPGTAETFPFGRKTSVFKVAVKVFALAQLGEDPLRVSLKCEPGLAEQLRATHPTVIPGYHLNKKQWNTPNPQIDDRSYEAPNLFAPGSACQSPRRRASLRSSARLGGGCTAGPV